MIFSGPILFFLRFPQCKNPINSTLDNGDGFVKRREENYKKRIENWMEIQMNRRIYELGSLPPFFFSVH